MVEKGYQPEVITCNSSINGFCKLGDNNAALLLLTGMEETGFRPDMVTYNIIIDSFCKDKLAVEASKPFPK